MAWYGGSFAYYDDEPAVPDDGVLDAAAERARQERRAGFTPEQFGPPPEPKECTAVVLGRFLPVHDGHRYLIELAQRFAERVHVFVRVGDDDPIPWEVRRGWLAELFPGVGITGIEESEASWPARILAEVRPDYLFGGEGWGPPLADELGATYVVVDRAAIPVTGTQVRADPWACERYLPPPVRAWYTRRVSIIGAESTGKTTLAHRLAQHYGTVWAPERIRTMRRRHLTPADLALAAQGQQADADLLARRASRVLFCDTDPLTVRLWCDRLFGAAPSWLPGISSPHLYVLCAADVPFIGEERNNTPTERRDFHAACERELVRLGRPYVILDGPLDDRLPRAIEAVDALLARPAP
jgi:HTH-type transcriptional repressor of NAD biosynthesis genes